MKEYRKGGRFINPEGGSDGENRPSHTVFAELFSPKVHNKRFSALKKDACRGQQEETYYAERTGIYEIIHKYHSDREKNFLRIMELLDPTLKWKRRPFPRYRPNSLLDLCCNIGLESDYMITEINDLGVKSSVGLALLFLEDAELSIKLSLMKSRVEFLPSLAGEFNPGYLNGVDT